MYVYVYVRLFFIYFIWRLFEGFIFFIDVIKLAKKPSQRGEASSQLSPKEREKTPLRGWGLLTPQL